MSEIYGFPSNISLKLPYARAFFLALWPEGIRSKQQASLTADTVLDHTELDQAHDTW